MAHLRGVSPDADTIGGLTLKAGTNGPAHLRPCDRTRPYPEGGDQCPEKAGTNVLVIKVGQGVGGWGLAARFELPERAATTSAGAK